MKRQLSPEEWVKEFQEFLSVDEKAPPQSLTDQIITHVHRDLNPGKISVFAKLALLHSIVGTITLLTCPYSELYSFPSLNPMKFLMQFGEQVCMLGCGALFLGTSALVASLVLRPEEVQVIRKTRVRQLLLVAVGSMAIFVYSGLLFLQGLALFWAIGSFLGGLLTLELGWALRSWIRTAHHAG